MNWHDYFTYNPETGDLIWKERPTARKEWNTSHANKVAGSGARKGGRRTVGIYGTLYMSARVIWEMHYGPIPEGIVIDHINGIESDDRLSNLRQATRSQNSQNVCLTIRNTSGHKGVSWSIRLKKWRADIRVNGKNVLLGMYTIKDEAIQARVDAEVKYFGEFSRAIP